MTERRLGNRDVGLAAALVAGAAGVVAREPTLLLAATVGLVYAAYEAATGLPEPDIEIERSLSTASPRPGERVDVTVTVRNHGTSALPDVRLVDGVPNHLRVVEGSPRFGTALEPDAEDSFSYGVRARRGDHPFRETTVVCRNLTGDAEYRDAVRVDGELSCRIGVDDVELAPETMPVAGRVETAAPGEGVSFYGIREYQSSDSVNRVDWNRFARTEQLSTVEFEATRAASVVLLVDERLNEAAGPYRPTASQLSKYAAERIATSLLAGHNRVGAALFDAGAFVSPGTDRAQRLRIRRLLLYERLPADRPDAADSTLDGFDGQAFFDRRSDATEAVTDGGPAVETLDRRFPDGAQVVFCTPLLDDRARDAAARLAAYGRSVTVVSPDVTSRDTPGSTVERITRRHRMTGLRRSVRLVDWSPSDPLWKALETATERWSR